MFTGGMSLGRSPKNVAEKRSTLLMFTMYVQMILSENRSKKEKAFTIETP